jgi:hypothetical protein
MRCGHWVAGALLLAAGLGAWYWALQPKTPRELFEVRCSSCHALPDLTDYRREDMAPLVDFMRTHNGASRVISDGEAPRIVAYLEQLKGAPGPTGE